MKKVLQQTLSILLEVDDNKRACLRNSLLKSFLRLEGDLLLRALRP